MSGGKGGSSTSATEIPPWMEEAAKYSLSRGKEADKIGYMPYYGPDVAAFTPMQEQAFQGTMDAASAFGMAPQGQYKDPMADLKQDFGGMSGYSSGGLYEQAVKEFEARRPNQAAQYNKFFTQENTQGGNYNPRVNPYMPSQQTGIYGTPYSGPINPTEREAEGRIGAGQSANFPVPPVDYNQYMMNPLDMSYATPQAQTSNPRVSGAAAIKRRAQLASR